MVSMIDGVSAAVRATEDMFYLKKRKKFAVWLAVTAACAPLFPNDTFWLRSKRIFSSYWTHSRALEEDIPFIHLDGIFTAAELWDNNRNNGEISHKESVALISSAQADWQLYQNTQKINQIHPLEFLSSTEPNKNPPCKLSEDKTPLRMTFQCVKHI